MTAAPFIYYGMFFTGYALHVGLQIDAAVRSSKTANVTRKQVIGENLAVLGSRLFVSFILLTVLRLYPGLLSPILGFAGITVTGISITTSSWIFSGMWGYTVDSIATFIPILKNYVPPLNDVLVKVEKSTTVQEGQPTKETTTVTAEVPTKTIEMPKP
jgi:hypothetical protein